MKNISLFLFALVALSLAGCKKSYIGDTYDFSDSKAPYVEFPVPRSPISATQGSTITAIVQMRTAVTENVIVNYTITGTTATIAGSVVILRNTLKATASIVLPTGIVAAGSTVVAQLKLVSALKGTDNLRIGAIVPTTEVIALTIKP